MLNIYYFLLHSESVIINTSSHCRLLKVSHFQRATRVFNGNFVRVFPAAEWSSCQLLLETHERARGDWEQIIISSNSMLEVSAGHAPSVFQMFRPWSVTSFWYVSAFPHFHVPFIVRCKFWKRLCISKQTCFFVWRMLLRTAAPNGVLQAAEVLL